MKKLLFFTCILLSVNAFSQITVSPDSAKYYDGTLVRVCGKITGTHIGKSGVIQLNFGGKYPNNTFTAVIFSDNTTKFEPAESYDGKDVCVSGKIKMYKEKPEIELKDPKQLILK